MSFRFTSLLMILFFACLVFSGSAPAQDKSADDSVKQAVANAAKRLSQKQTYELKYQFKQGEDVRWKVLNNIATKMQEAGFTEESSSQMESEILWKVTNVDSLGNMTYVNSLQAVSGWEKFDDEEPVTFDSRKDEKAPKKYQAIATQIGKPTVVFTIASNGKVIDRKSSLKEHDLAAGRVTIPLPANEIAIGHQWYEPNILTANDENGRKRQIKTRVVYELTSVNGFHAGIKFRTEVLTPSISEKIKSTILQHLSEGYLVFDIKAGRPIKKLVKWDERSQGFNGPDSSLSYIGQVVIELVTEKSEKSAVTRKENNDQKSVAIRTRESKPVLRK